tara:strand:+ start:327 stop:674 length:348 start_codon:yes stop_codon:yes gene_type:complete
VNICIATNSKSVSEAISKNFIGDYSILEVTSEITELDDSLKNLDYLFVDMRFGNSGGPSTIKKMKNLYKKEGEKGPFYVLLADREVDIIQGKRVGADEIIVKPLTLMKIKKILTK